MLREVEWLRYEEIAFYLGLTVGTVKSRLHYATRLLRDELAVDRVESRKVRPA